MEDLYFEKVNFYSPEVNFSYHTGECSIEGDSALEDTVEFYTQLINWLNDYFNRGNKAIELSIKLTYLNTSSIRAFLDLFMALKEHLKAGKPVEVKWLYQEPDYNEIKMEGEDLASITGLPIQLVPYQANE